MVATSVVRSRNEKLHSSSISTNAILDESLIVAKVLDANNNIVGFNETVSIPSRRTSFSPRIDYQINPNNTLVARYNYAKNTRVTGVGGFSFRRALTTRENSEQSIQLTETAVINKTIVNETRFQFEHQANAQDADNSIPTIEVSEAFTGGGSQVGQSHSTDKRLGADEQHFVC